MGWSTGLSVGQAMTWGEVSPSGDAMHVLRFKLKHLRNRDQFGLVHERVSKAK